MRAYPIFMWLFEASIGAGVLVGLILLARATLRGALGNRLVYLLWLLVAVRLLLPLQLPSLILPQVETNAGTVSLSEAGERQVRLLTHEVSETLAMAAARQPYERITQATITAYRAMQPNARGLVWLGVYVLGVLLTGGYMAWQNHRFRRYVKRHAIGPLDGGAAAAYACYAKALHLRPPKALLVDPLDSACLMGGLRPMIALPVSGGDAPYILLHELCHYRNGDALWGVVRNLCCALFWFHPLVWVAAHVSRADCELACDERVAASLTDSQRAEYAALLVRLAACRRTPRAGVLATGMSMTGTRLKQRVRQILTSRKAKLWVLVAAAMCALAVLTTCFATATVVPPEVAAGFEASDPVPQDAWLKRDVAAWFPQNDMDTVARDNTAASTRFGYAYLLPWAYDAGLTVACAAQANGAGESYPIRFTYTVGLGGETQETCKVAAMDEARWQTLRDYYYSYAAAYAADGTLVCVVRQPRVSALNRRLVQRSAGETLSGLEYNVRAQDVLAQYQAWVDAHAGQFDAAITAAQAQALQIGWAVTSVVGTTYQQATDNADPVALQLITLQTPQGGQATFSVEMETWRVLAISFAQDWAAGLAADVAAMGTQVAPATDAVKPQNEAQITAVALAAMRQYFDETPAADAAVTLRPASDADETRTGWMLTVTPPAGNLCYRVEVGADGALRTASRTVTGLDFRQPFDMDSFPYLNEHPERYHLSEKTLFWLNGGATEAEGGTLPPEVAAAIADTDAYIRDKGLPFTQCTGYMLYWEERWLLQREGDVGIEFTYRNGDDDQGYRLFYSTLQQAVGAVDFGEDGSAEMADAL